MIVPTLIAVTPVVIGFDLVKALGGLLVVHCKCTYVVIFMANSGGAWDNAKNLLNLEIMVVKVAMHKAAVTGDTVEIL